MSSTRTWKVSDEGANWSEFIGVALKVVHTGLCPPIARN